uniref:Uncharacterized protein n=1 Tax=Anguilla anguilla TaxID=7936 RepID=A0A0E9QDZ6_ANGAN
MQQDISYSTFYESVQLVAHPKCGPNFHLHVLNIECLYVCYVPRMV